MSRHRRGTRGEWGLEPEEDRGGKAEQPHTRAPSVLDQWRWGLRKRPRVLWANVIILVIAGIWAGSMWLAPYTVEEGSVGDLSGGVGIHDNDEEFEDMNAFARFMYRAGDSQCHQMRSRTLILNDNQMPFCTRCVAIYTLLAIGVAITVFPGLPYYDRITSLRWEVLVAGLVPIGIDGVGQMLGYWESTNLLRFVTGGLCGLVTGIALGFMLREIGPAVEDLRKDLRDWREERRMMKGTSPQEEGPPLEGKEDG